MGRAYPATVAEPRADTVNTALALIGARVAGVAAMATDSPGPAAGGFPIALGAIGGAVIGTLAHEPTIGFLAGLAAGVAVAVAIWLRGR